MTEARMPEEEFWGRFNEGKLDRRTFMKVAAVLGGAVAFGIPLVACQPAASNPPAPPKQTFEMKLALASPMLSFTSIYSGDARNFFAQEGIKNAITEFSGGPDQVRAILTGGYPLGVTSPTAGMGALESGEAARYIASGFDGSQVGFLVKADSVFKRPDDLKSKKFKIGYSRPNSASHILAFLGLKAVGIDPNDKNQVEFVSTGGTAETWTATKTGLIDIGWSTESTISDVELKKEGRALWMARDLVKDWTEYGLLTSQSVIDSSPKQLQAWVNAVVKSLDWVKNNYSEAAKDLAKVLGIENAVAEAALNKIPKDAWTAAMRKKSWEFAAKASIDFKQLKGMPDWKVLVNQSFLPENLRDPGY